MLAKQGTTAPLLTVSGIFFFKLPFSYSPPPRHSLGMKQNINSIQPFHVPLREVYVGENDAEFFKESYGRRLNTLNPRYKLPVDSDEIKVCMLQYIHSIKT